MGFMGWYVLKCTLHDGRWKHTSPFHAVVQSPAAAYLVPTHVDTPWILMKVRNAVVRRWMLA